MMISICVPMYNESSIIAETAKTLHTYMKNNFGDDFEIVFSDDGSRDGSAEIVNDLAFPNVRVVGYEDNQGKGCAVRNAILSSVGDVVIFTDADLAYGVEIISDACERIKEGECDVVIASRAKHERGYEGYTPIRKIVSKTYIKFLNFLLGIKVSDAQCGFKAFDGDNGRRIFSFCSANNFAFDLEVILIAQKMKLRIFEMPAMIINHRESKVNVLRDAPRMVKEALNIKKRVKSVELEP